MSRLIFNIILAVEVVEYIYQCYVCIRVLCYGVSYTDINPFVTLKNPEQMHQRQQHMLIEYEQLSLTRRFKFWYSQYYNLQDFESIFFSVLKKQNRVPASTNIWSKLAHICPYLLLMTLFLNVLFRSPFFHRSFSFN